MRKQSPDEVLDADLIPRALRGEDAAWRALVGRHTPRVYRLSARMLGAGAEAEDACQEAFMKMHHALDSYDLARPLAPWLARITYHVCLTRLSKVGRAGFATDPDELSAMADADEPGPERDAASREAGQLVVRAMDRLSAQDRALVTMRYRDGLTDEEVGEAVGMNHNTVRTRLHRARLVLRRALAPVLGGRLE